MIDCIKVKVCDNQSNVKLKFNKINGSIRYVAITDLKEQIGVDKVI